MPVPAASFFKENVMIRKTILAIALGTVFAAPMYNVYAEGEDEKKADLIVAEGEDEKKADLIVAEGEDEKKADLIS